MAGCWYKYRTINDLKRDRPPDYLFFIPLIPMAKKPTLHSHSDQQAFDRLLLLIATLVQYPGVGASERDDKLLNSDRQHNNALETVRIKLR